MWWKESVFYQIYPLGFCGAERVNDFGETRHRLGEIEKEIGRLKELGIKAVLFNPFLQSDAHGYDTADFYSVDCRLGTNDEFAALTAKFHASGIKVVADGVFNHVGMQFPEFKALKEKRTSDKLDYFHAHFGGDGNLYYEGWEGHNELARLNLSNTSVRGFLFDAVRFWIDKFDIDGLRLDVAYMLPEDFIRELSGVVREKKADFFVVGEAIHGDYNRLLGCGADSVTNYECYKGIHSAINSKNLFEIEHSLSRQFADTAWALYKGRHLFGFVENHDVPRICTVLSDKQNTAAAYAILFAMPGIPCIYYGGEYGAQGGKGDADIHLRPPMKDIDRNANGDLYERIKNLVALRNARKSLQYGSYRKLTLANEFFSFMRECDGEKTVLGVNISDSEKTVDIGGEACDLANGEKASGSACIAPHSYRLFDVK